MINKLKLPLTAVNILLVSASIIYPWAAIQAENTNLSSKQLQESKIALNTVTQLNYRFSESAVAHSNLAIEKQLKNYKADASTVIVEFSASALQKSNLAIKRQLGHYSASNDKKIIESTQPVSISDLDVPEQPETALLVNDVPDYLNEDGKDSDGTERTTAVFSKALVKLSNLAIKKQLRSYNMTSINQTAQAKSIAPSTTINQMDDAPLVKHVTQELAHEQDKKPKSESESELLMSNNAHEDEENDDDDDDDDYSRVSDSYKIKKAKEQTKLSSTNNRALANGAAVNEEEDEDEYGSERVVFNNEPYYFTESFEKKSESIIDDNIALPNVEDIHESTNAATSEEQSTLEIIEEIEISDDGTIITSQAK